VRKRTDRNKSNDRRQKNNREEEQQEGVWQGDGKDPAGNRGCSK